MLTLQKNQSNESGNFNGTTKKLCSITIDGDGVYNLRHSYLAFKTEIVATDPSGGIHNVGLKNSAQSLIRNAVFTSDRVGDLENIPRQNVLHSNIEKFSKSHEQRDCESIWSGAFRKDEFDNYRSCFRELNTTADSENRSPELQVPLRDVFGIASTPQYPAMMMNSSTVELEFDAPAELLEEKHRYTASSKLVLKDAAAGVVTTLDASGGALGYSTKSRLGLWRNQYVQISYDASGSFTHNTLISAISAPASNVITITLAAGLPDSGAHAKTNVRLVELTASSSAYSITDVKLVLMKEHPNNGTSDKIKRAFRGGVSIPYMTYTLEQIDMPAGNEFNKQFYLDPNCRGTLLMAVDNDKLESEITNVASYRTRTNGEDNTSVDVLVGDPLYKDRILYTFNSLDERVRNLRDIPFLAANPNPMNNEQTQYAITIKGAAMTARTLHLYKAVQRVLDIKGNNVSVQ